MVLTFCAPHPQDEARLREYAQEHFARGEMEITAGMGLGKIPFDRWLAQVEHSAAVGDAGWGRSLLLLCLDGEALVGLLSVRYELSAADHAKYGDIGYGVRPSRRRQGYATQMLRHGLRVCRAHGMTRALLGCFKSNAGSAATITACGGHLLYESDSYEKGRLSQYYEIVLE